MAINGVSVNNTNEEHINYDAVENRISSAVYNKATNVLTFHDEEGTQKFNVEIEQDTLELDTTLAKTGYAADAKAVGDEIARVESSIPNVDSTLSVNGDAADAGATGSAIVNAMNHVAEGFNDAMDAYLIENAYGQMYVDENNGLHVSPVTPSAETVITDSVDDWLDDHPEATTTVEDGSITVSKLHEDVSTQLYPSVAYYGITASTVDCGAVVNNLLSNGVTVFRFLKGEYTFTTPITADIKNCLFIGESGTVLKNNTGGYLVTSAKISRTTFSNFNVDGGSGFYMINTSTAGYYYAYVHFDKVMFTNVETAITYGGKGGYIYVDKCIVRANDVGIIIGNTNAYTTENFYVRDCQIGGTTDGTSTGIEVHSGQNIYITGNDLPKLDTAIKVFNDIERPVSYLQIENNNIYGFTTNGILFHPTVSASTAYIRWGTVERNVFFTANNVTAISNDTSIAVRNYSFSDNMFTLTNGTAFAADGSFATSYWNGGNSCNGANWFNRLGSTFKPTFDGTLPHYRASVPASGSTTVDMPSSYSTQWQKFVYALVFPTQGNNLQYLTSSVDTTTGAVTVNNSSTSAVTVSVSWMS